MAEIFTNPFTDTVVLNLISAGLYLIIGLIMVSLLMKFIRSFLKDDEVKTMLERIGIRKQGLDILLSGVRIYLYHLPGNVTTWSSAWKLSNIFRPWLYPGQSNN